MENEEELDLLKKIKSSVESHPNRNYLYYYHKHPLKLYDKKDDVDRRQSENHEEEEEIICSSCSLPIVNGSSKYYWCEKCRHFFHNSCAESPTTILHPFHISHPLSLLQSPPERSCSACKLNIIIGSSASYGCLDCEIFFHDFCLQLPHELKENLHSYPYPLFLSSGGDHKFKCRGCSRACSGFSYSCRKYDIFPSKFCISCMFSLQTIHEYYAAKVAHMLTIHSAVSLDDSTRVCRVCAKEMGRLAFFMCDECEFYFHIHCVLQPTFTSPHHRHLLKLTYNHLEEEETEEDDDDEEELICDHCEKTRYPDLPVYQCPEQGCSFVAHCYCPLMEENLSIAHKLGEREDEDGISIVVIKDPLSAALQRDIARFPNNIMDNLKDLEILVAKKMKIEGNEWSVKSLSTEFSMYSSHPDFPEFFENHESNGVKDVLKLYDDLSMTVLEEYMTSTKLEAVMELLFANYGDFSKNFLLSNSMGKILFFNILCMSMLQICCIEEDEKISKEDLLFWLDCFRLVHSVGFEIHFALPRFKKALHSFFGGDVCYNYQAMYKLDTDMIMIFGDISEPDSPLSAVHSNMTSIMINKETSCVELGEYAEAVKFKGKNTVELDNSWEQYTIETRGEEVESFPGLSALMLLMVYQDMDPNEVGSTYRFVEKIRDMGLWDYSSLIHKMEAFLINHHEMNGAAAGGGLFGGDDQPMQLHLIDIPFNLCKKCDLLVQSGSKLLRKTSCSDNRPHDLTVIPTALSPFNLKEDRDIHYEIDKTCFICDLPIWGSAYKFYGHGHGYKRNNILFIHKFCVNYPREFHHKHLHPEHTLSLSYNLNHRRKSTDSEEVAKKCNACGNKVCNYRGGVYSCETCNFYLEPRCIFQDSMVTLVSSRSCGHHPLMFVEQNTEYDPDRNCSLCETELVKSFYLHCGTCDLSYCIWCTLPAKVFYSRHCHELQITENYVEDNSGEYYCDACEEPRVEWLPIYCCMECNYAAHIRCVISDLSINEPVLPI